MNAFLDPRARRIPVLLCLALFLAGSNNCLLGAWAGRDAMTCMMLPNKGIAPHACCHRAATTANAPAKQPAAKRSCCPDPAVVPSAFAAQKEDAVSAAPMVPSLAAVSMAAPLVASTWNGRPAAANESPPASHHRAPAPARAPPLA